MLIAKKMAAFLRTSPITTLPRPKPTALTRISSSIGHKNPSKIRFLPCQSQNFLANSSSTIGFGGNGRLKLGFGQRGFAYFRSEEVADGSSAGGGGGEDGGGFGGWGDGNSGGGGDERGGNDSFFLSWYLTALDKHPVITKAITSAFLTLIGDLICQLLIDHVPQLDLNRTCVFTFLGLVLVGPTLHFWYLSLSKMVTTPGAPGAFLRLLLDQFGFSPLFIGVFLSALTTLEGRPSQVVPKLKQEWFSAVIANWQLWIPFQFLNFLFVPQKFQVLGANVVALAWNVILSFKAHKEVVMK